MISNLFFAKGMKHVGNDGISNHALLFDNSLVHIEMNVPSKNNRIYLFGHELSLIIIYLINVKNVLMKPFSILLSLLLLLVVFNIIIV